MKGKSKIYEERLKMCELCGGEIIGTFVEKELPHRNKYYHPECVNHVSLWEAINNINSRLDQIQGYDD
jgi:hypothetical protein